MANSGRTIAKARWRSLQENVMCAALGRAWAIDQAAGQTADPGEGAMLTLRVVQRSTAPLGTGPSVSQAFLLTNEPRGNCAR
jgi:hypothetical protein